MSFGASFLLGTALVVGAGAADELRDAREHGATDQTVTYQRGAKGEASRLPACGTPTRLGSAVPPDDGGSPNGSAELPLSMEQRVRLCNEGLDWACPAPPGRYLGVLVLLALLVLVVFAAALPPRASKTAGK